MAVANEGLEKLEDMIVRQAEATGAQDEDDVFERYHRHQRPEDERDDPKDVGRGRERMPGGAQRD